MRCQPMRFGRVSLGKLSGAAVDIAELACLNLTDLRAGMSVHRRIAHRPAKVADVAS